MVSIKKDREDLVNRNADLKQKVELRFADATAVRDLPLVHTCKYEILKELPSLSIPTSADENYCSNATRRTEDWAGLENCVYFYVGRAHKAFGNLSLVFEAVDLERKHSGCVTPFDTGGIIAGFIDTNFKKIKVLPMIVDDGSTSDLIRYELAKELSVKPDDIVAKKVGYRDALIDKTALDVYTVSPDFAANPKRVLGVPLGEIITYIDESRIDFDDELEWRDEMVGFVATYFETCFDFLYGTPDEPVDPEQILELNIDRRAWTFEVRIREEVEIMDCKQWAAPQQIVHKMQLDRFEDDRGLFAYGSNSDYSKFMKRRLKDDDPRTIRRSDEIINDWVHETYIC